MEIKNIKNYGIRSFDVSSENINADKRTVRMTLSSETPYMREDWDLGKYWEVLGHNSDEVDLSRMNNGAPFLFEHDPERQVGRVENVTLDSVNKNTIIDVRFSKNPFPSEIFNDIVDGIKTKTSAGYRVLKAVIVGYDKDGIAIVRVTKWQLMEGSSVSIPADDSVGVLRSMSKNEQQQKLVIEYEKKNDELTPVDPVTAEIPDVIVEQMSGEKTAEENNLENNVEKLDSEINNLQNSSIGTSLKFDNEISNGQNTINTKGNKMDIAGIYKKAEAFGVKDEVVTKFMKSGKTEAEFDDFVRESNAEKTRGISNMDQIGLNENDNEMKEYSLFRGIESLRTGKKSLETEMSDTIAKRTGQASTGGFLLPMAYLKKAAAYGARTSARAYNSAPGDASGVENLVAEILDSANMVEILRHRLVTAGLGVKHVSGLVGDYAVPRQISGNANTWVGDSGASTESSAVFDKIVAKPKMLVSETQLFELAMKQTTPDAQYLAMDDMLKSRAVELDRVTLWGSGSGNQPMGIANTSGVTVLTGATNGEAISRDQLIDLMAALGNLDANVDNARYVSNFRVKAALMKLKADAGSGVFVWDEFKSLFAITNNIPSNLTKGTGTGLSGIIFGDFSDVIVCDWGTPELIVDNLTQAKYGKVNIYMRQATDVLVRRPQSFAVKKDIIA